MPCSATFLAALEFPEMLMTNDGHTFLNVVEESTSNSELRHLVQGAALRGLVLPTNGAARNPGAMDQVLQILIEIGTVAEGTVKDSWDCFFQDQVAMKSQQQDVEFGDGYLGEEGSGILVGDHIGF